MRSGAGFVVVVMGCDHRFGGKRSRMLEVIVRCCEGVVIAFRWKQNLVAMTDQEDFWNPSCFYLFSRLEIIEK